MTKATLFVELSIAIVPGQGKLLKQKKPQRQTDI